MARPIPSLFILLKKIGKTREDSELFIFTGDLTIPGRKQCHYHTHSILVNLKNL